MNTRSAVPRGYTLQSDLLGKAQKLGRLEALRVGLEIVLDARELVPSPDHAAQIDACNESAALEDWIRKAATATSVGAVFSPRQSAFARKHEAMGRAAALLTAIDARGFTLGEGQRERVLYCVDPNELDTWTRRTISAPAVEHIFE